MDFSADCIVLGVASVGKEILLFVRDAEGKKNRPIRILKSVDGVVFDLSKRKVYASLASPHLF